MRVLYIPAKPYNGVNINSSFQQVSLPPQVKPFRDVTMLVSLQQEFYPSLPHTHTHTHTHTPYFVIKIWNVRLYSLWKRHMVIEEAYTLNKVLKYSVVHLKDSCASEAPALDTTDIVYIFVLPLTAKIVLPLISPSH